jgi:hypothetical protein
LLLLVGEERHYFEVVLERNGPIEPLKTKGAVLAFLGTGGVSIFVSSTSRDDVATLLLEELTTLLIVVGEGCEAVGFEKLLLSRDAGMKVVQVVETVKVEELLEGWILADVGHELVEALATHDDVGVARVPDAATNGKDTGRCGSLVFNFVLQVNFDFVGGLDPFESDLSKVKCL